MISWNRYISIFLFILIPHTGFAQPQTLLKSTDVPKFMTELLQHHVQTKQMNPELLQNAVRYYIEQFDRNHIYLLVQEVRPYAYLSPTQLNELMGQYENGDFSLFTKLDALFVRAIERARTTRKALYKNNNGIFETADANNNAQSKRLESLPFATSPQELQSRTKEAIVDYIGGQIRKFGAQDVLANRKTVLENYEDDSVTHENPYLYEDIEGRPLNISSKENLFTIRILKSLAATLDAHTWVFNPEEAYDMRVRLEKGLRGTGLEVRKSPDGVFVEKILRTSPAAKQGSIQVGDRLVEINGRVAHNIPFEELVTMLRGDEAKNVTLLMKHKAEPSKSVPQHMFTVNLTPALITVDEDRVTTSYVPYGNGIIGTIALKSFYKGENGVTSEKDVTDAIAKLNKIGNLRGLILDLRGNSGGFLTQAVKVAGLFITNGVIVVSKYSNGEEHFYRDVDGKTSYDGPLVVLTSKTTASAAEIVAQALQDYGVALVVGDPQTYGKGTIQSQTVTDGDQAASYFKVTVGKYYTVSGKTPQLQGVKSDIIVPSELSFEDIGEEFVEGAIPADSIQASFSDQLADIEPQMKPWFLHYYVPTMQSKLHKWRDLLPTIREKSIGRIHDNPQYQKILKGLLKDQQNDRLSKDDSKPLQQLQMDETINIVKDMITLDPTIKHSPQS